MFFLATVYSCENSRFSLFGVTYHVHAHFNTLHRLSCILACIFYSVVNYQRDVILYYILRWHLNNLHIVPSRSDAYSVALLWPPCVADADIIFLSCGFFLLSFFFFFYSSPNLSGRRLDVYHTSTHGVALVRI